MSESEHNSATGVQTHLTTILQSSTLTITPQGHPHFLFMYHTFFHILIKHTLYSSSNSKLWLQVYKINYNVDNTENYQHNIIIYQTLKYKKNANI